NRGKSKWQWASTSFTSDSAIAGSMLPGFMELYIRVPFLCQVEVDHSGRNIRQPVTPIERKIIIVLALKLLKFTLIGTGYPACSSYIDWLINGLNLVLGLQTTDHHIKLQNPYGTNN